MLDALQPHSNDQLSACIAHGLLGAGKDGIAFRHAIVRDAILDGMDPLRRRALSRVALKACAMAKSTQRDDFAHLAELAEQAGDTESVLKYAALAAESAADFAAHREAHAQYARLIRFAQHLPPEDRALYRSRHADECAFTDNLDAAVASYMAAAELWKQAGNRIREGEVLAKLAWPLVRNGQNKRADVVIADAVNLLEPFGDTQELAVAYRIQAHLRMLDRDRDEAVRLGERAITLASRLDDIPTLAAAEIVVGAARLVSGDDGGREHFDRAIQLAQLCGKHRDATLALAYLNLGSSYGEQYRLSEAEAALTDGIAFARERDLDHHEHYMASWLALTRMFQGRWSEAVSISEGLLARTNVAVISRIMALVALGRVRARQGQKEAHELLEEAAELADATGTLQRVAPVHAARAELAWLENDPTRAVSEASRCFDLAIQRRHKWHVGELCYWRRRGDASFPTFDWIAAPYSAQLAGDWLKAANEWERLGCPYEHARALAEGDEPAQRVALAIFDRLEALPAAAALRRSMRARGVRSIPRGRRASTLENPDQLTRREIDVLKELVQGLSNNEIGEKLFISPKTVDHHVSAILAKLGATSRHHAAELARSRNIVA